MTSTSEDTCCIFTFSFRKRADLWLSITDDTQYSRFSAIVVRPPAAVDPPTVVHPPVLVHQPTVVHIPVLVHQPTVIHPPTVVHQLSVVHPPAVVHPLVVVHLNAQLSSITIYSYISRFAVFSLFGRNLIVRRILTACLLSFLALLGSVLFDLRVNFALLHTTEAAYDELTSCRTTVILQLISKLQKMRHLFPKDFGNDTLDAHFFEAVLPVFNHVCGEMSGQNDDRGHRCTSETASFCKEMRRNVQGFLNISLDTNMLTGKYTSAYSLAIERLMDIWGTVQDTFHKVKQNLVWRDVLSARLLLTFIELNQQLMDSDHLATRADFQHKWSYVLTHLGFAMIMTDRFQECWFENIIQKLNTSQNVNDSYMFDSSMWRISKAGTEVLSGSHVGVEALRNTQQCLFDRAVPALRLASKSVSSELSMRVCCLFGACLIYPVVIFSFKQMTEWIQNFAKNLKEKTEDLKHQRQLAEDLLHQMLPKSVAKQLRQQKHVEAESYEKVSVGTKDVWQQKRTIGSLISAVCGFTYLISHCGPNTAPLAHISMTTDREKDVRYLVITRFLRGEG